MRQSVPSVLCETVARLAQRSSNRGLIRRSKSTLVVEPKPSSRFSQKTVSRNRTADLSQREVAAVATLGIDLGAALDAGAETEVEAVSQPPGRRVAEAGKPFVPGVEAEDRGAHYDSFDAVLDDLALVATPEEEVQPVL